MRAVGRGGDGDRCDAGGAPGLCHFDGDCVLAGGGDDDEHVVGRHAVAAEDLGREAGHFLHPARFGGAVIQHEVGVQYWRDVGEAAGAVEGVQGGEVGVAAAEDVDDAVADYDVRHGVSRAGDRLPFLRVDRAKILNYPV